MKTIETIYSLYVKELKEFYRDKRLMWSMYFINPIVVPLCLVALVVLLGTIRTDAVNNGTIQSKHGGTVVGYVVQESGIDVSSALKDILKYDLISYSTKADADQALNENEVTFYIYQSWLEGGPQMEIVYDGAKDYADDSFILRLRSKINIIQSALLEEFLKDETIKDSLKRELTSPLNITITARLSSSSSPELKAVKGLVLALWFFLIITPVTTLSRHLTSMIKSDYDIGFFSQCSIKRISLNYSLASKILLLVTVSSSLALIGILFVATVSEIFQWFISVYIEPRIEKIMMPDIDSFIVYTTGIAKVFASLTVGNYLSLFIGIVFTTAVVTSMSMLGSVLAVRSNNSSMYEGVLIMVLTILPFLIYFDSSAPSYIPIISNIENFYYSLSLEPFSNIVTFSLLTLITVAVMTYLSMRLLTKRIGLR